MSFLIAWMKSTTTKIIWWAIHCSAFNVIRPRTFNQIHIAGTMSVSCSVSWATRSRTITPWCPVCAIGSTIFARFCWASDRIWKWTRCLSRNILNRTISSFGFVTATTWNWTITPIWPQWTFIFTRIWTIWWCTEIKSTRISSNTN